MTCTTPPCAWSRKPSRNQRLWPPPSRRKPCSLSHKSKMTFAHPWFLLLLLLLPLMAWLKGKRGAPPAFLYSSVQLVRAVLNVSRSRSGAFLAALRWLALALLIIAIAQPRLTKSQTQVKASGIDIAVAIDLSGSMAS